MRVAGSRVEPPVWHHIRVALSMTSRLVVRPVQRAACVRQRRASKAWQAHGVFPEPVQVR